MWILESNAILWLASWTWCRRKHNHDFFWLGTVLLNATVSVINSHNWNEAQISSRHNGADQWQYSNSRRINHMLSDILISTQILVTHLVTTFLSVIITTFLENTWRVGSSNKMWMLSPSICFDYLSGQIEREKLPILFLGTTPSTKSSSMWWSHQLLEAPLWSSQ